MILYLIGYMGCGKSSIGRRAAKAVGVAFLDTDDMVEMECGMTVAEIFAREGELFFRERERVVLEKIAGRQDSVIVATGGGMPCHGDNMTLMNESGRTVYLRFAPEKLVGRIGGGRSKRPLLSGMDGEQMQAFIKRSLEEREEYYMCAGAVVECDGLSDEKICALIVEQAAKNSSIK